MEIEPLAELGPTRRAALFDRDAGIEDISDDVATIISQVRRKGDAALRQYSADFDGIQVGNFAIGDDLKRAEEEIDQSIHHAIESAVDNVREFHELQRRDDWWVDIGGRRLGRRFRPLDRIGAYVPGGTAAYPSSAIMTVIPAVVAGVEDIVVATPPGDPINQVTLAALHIAGADEVYQVGGAQAIAALAYGTESIPRVQKIVGPGNQWVTAAKAAVQGDVEIDFLAGPSEILVIADSTATPEYIAADLIAQAEHGNTSPCVLVTDDKELAEAVVNALEKMTSAAARQANVREALEAPASGIFLARSMSEAISFAETYAPEHLSIQTTDPGGILDRIDSVGSAFLGPMTPVAAGDYASGTNHVLPTNGVAKVAGGLSVDSFLRATTMQELDASSLKEIGPTIKTLAKAEGLIGHAESVDIRLNDGRQR